MAQILPRDLTSIPGGTINPAAAIIVDNGDGVFKGTPADVVNSGAPVNSQGEAEAGAVNSGRMTPLRVKQAIDALGVSQDVLASSTGGAMVGLNLGGLLDDGIKFITAAMAGIPDDGDEGADVTAELTALASAAGALNLPVHLGARTYLTDGTTINFTTSVRGLAGTVIKSSATTEEQHVLTMSGDGTTLESVGIDGNCSADPSPWNSGNYNSFTGNRGLKVTGSNVTVRDVVVENVRFAGFLVDPGAEQVVFQNCTANRCRGNFGDGFIAMGTKQIVYLNCRAYDFTRIGFVADAYGEVGQHCKQIAYINCHAEYGHDASILYGGAESNMGFWAERSGQISLDNCSVKDMTHSGYVMTSWSAATNLGQEQYQARNCTAEDVQNGFIVRGISPVPVRAVLESCHVDMAASGAEAAFVFSGTMAKDHVHLINCSAVLRGAVVRRCSVRCGPGTVIVDGFNETWQDIDNTLRDALDNYYGSVSHFNDAPGRVVVRDWRTLDSGGTLIGSVFKFLTPAASTLDLSIERTYVRGVQCDCLRYTARDVTYERLGNIAPRERMTIRGGSVLDGSQTSGIYLRLATKEILFDGVICDFSTSGGYLYFYNLTSSDVYPKMIMRGCRLIKNFETATVKYGIRVNGDGAVINTTNANHIVFSDGVIVNTGGTTTNGPFQLDSSVDAASKVHGRGNLKSSTLTNTVNGAKLATAASFEAWG